MPRTLICVALAALAAPALAQMSVTVPEGYANTVGNSNNTYPWSRGASSMRYQQVYDTSHFTQQGIAVPIVITGMRFRPYAAAVTSWVGGSWPNVQIDMASCPNDYLAASATFANNLGADLTTVHNGAVTVAAGSTLGVGVVVPPHIDIQLTTPFTYDPSLGNDLTIDVHLDGTGWTGTGRAADAVTGAAAGAKATRIYDTTGLSAPSGSVGTEYALVCELQFAPVAGILAAFTANTRTGSSPLAVQFTDQSYTNAPAGVQAWQWDFDGDNVIDSTLQNPTFTYTSCGIYPVTLTVNDGVHSASTTTRADFIVTDTVVPDFTWSLVAPGVVQFTDTSTPAANAWSWDLDGDNVPDSTSQNPVWSYGSNCAVAAVTLSVNRLCRGPFNVTKTVVASNSIETRRDGNTSTSTNAGGYFDLSITTPGGINICRMEAKTTAAVNAALTLNVFVAPDTYVGKNTNLALWRQVASVPVTGAPNATSLEVAQFSPPIYLPAGNYGMHVQVVGTSAQYTSQTTTQVFSNADLTLTTGGVGVLGGTIINNRTWNGAIYYGTAAAQEAGYGFFGYGCAGSLGISNLLGTRPQLGSTMSVTMNNLPQSVAIMLIGFSNTMSMFGPLPVDVTPFGAPGCYGRVSSDTTVLLIGGGNTAVWSFGVPADPGMIGLQLYNQGLVLDPGFNALGGVLSDAAGMIFGM